MVPPSSVAFLVVPPYLFRGVRLLHIISSRGSFLGGYNMKRDERSRSPSRDTGMARSWGVQWTQWLREGYSTADGSELPTVVPIDVGSNHSGTTLDAELGPDAKAGADAGSSQSGMIADAELSPDSNAGADGELSDDDRVWGRVVAATLHDSSDHDEDDSSDHDEDNPWGMQMGLANTRLRMRLMEGEDAYSPDDRSVAFFHRLWGRVAAATLPTSVTAAVTTTATAEAGGGGGGGTDDDIGGDGGNDGGNTTAEAATAAAAAETVATTTAAHGCPRPTGATDAEWEALLFELLD